MMMRLADRKRWREAWQHTAWLVTAHGGFKEKPWAFFPSAFPASARQEGGASGVTEEEQRAALEALKRRQRRQAQRRQQKESDGDRD